jgi:hypothetical protein
MNKTILLAAGALLTIGAVAFAAESAGLIGSGDAAPAFLASEVRLAPGGAALAQEAPPIEVLGAVVDCPPSGAGSEDTQQRYDEQGSTFRVIGTLSSFNAITAVVAGPTGDISAALAQEFELRGDLSAGTVVDLRGTIGEAGARTAHQVQSACASAGVIDCAVEDDPHFQLLVDSDSFQVIGRLDSVTADQVRVLGPGLIVEISRDASTQVEGGLNPGDPVKVEGTVLDDRQLRALTVALRCEEAGTATPATQAPAQSPATTDVDEDGECNRGSRGRGALRFELDDGEVRIKRGAVLASDAASLTIDTPAGPVVVRTEEDAKVDGDLASAVEVRVEGELHGDNSVLATEIKVLCPAGRNGDHEDGDDNGDKNDDHRGGGEGEGRRNRGGGGDDEGGGDDRGREGGDDEGGDDD